VVAEVEADRDACWVLGIASHGVEVEDRVERSAAAVRRPVHRRLELLNDGYGASILARRPAGKVRHTVIRVITAHLREAAAVSWQGLDLDFTGVVFDGGDFADAHFSGGTVNFRSAAFCGGTVDFSRAQITSGVIDFSDARDWSVPPKFPGAGTPPPGAELPEKEDQGNS
jgi:hypothetical protein